MKTSRLIASTSAALMLAGTIGLAQAQLGTGAQDANRSGAQQNRPLTTAQSDPALVNPSIDNQRRTDGSTAGTRDSSGRMTGGTATGYGADGQRPARSDRN